MGLSDNNKWQDRLVDRAFDEADRMPAIQPVTRPTEPDPKETAMEGEGTDPFPLPLRESVSS